MKSSNLKVYEITTDGKEMKKTLEIILSLVAHVETIMSDILSNFLIPLKVML
jgi:hypothetical protein